MQSDWTTVRLDSLGRIVTGKTPSTNDAENFGGSLPFLTPSDFADGRRRVATARTLSQKGLSTVKGCLIPGGVAVSCIGWQMGKAVLVDKPTVTNQQINTIVPDKTIVDRAYLFYALTSIRSKIFELGATSTRTPIVNKSTFGSIKIMLPPMAWQQSIAEVLGAIDDRIDLLRQTNGTLESIAQALFKSWFIDFDPVRVKAEGRDPEGIDAATAALFPAEFEESTLGLIPKGWGVEPIGDLVEAVGGSTPDTKNSTFWEPAVHHWTSPKDLSGATSPVLLDTERKVSPAGLAKISSGLLPAGSLLMSSRAPIGYLTLTQIPVAINQGYIAMPPGGRLPPLYLYFWCEANMDGIKGRANGSTFMEISKKAFRPIPALQPPQPLLDGFVEVAGALFERLVANERQARTLVELRDSLLPRLISGKLRLPDAQAQLEEAVA